jgi:outer membrane protein TolC
MNTRIVTAVAALLLTAGAHAHPIDSVLAQIERNNITLKSIGKAHEAEISAAKSANTLGETSVDYSPFYADGVSGVASSELVVSQGFDFPTLYAARSKANDIKKEELQHTYNLLRRDILAEARSICLDIIHASKASAMLEKRMEIAHKLLALYQKKADNGNATIIELNKVKMERMELEADLQQLKSDSETLLAQLTGMNGNMPIDFAATDYPQVPGLIDYNALAERYVATDNAIIVADSRTKSAEQEVSISKQNWIPKLTVGYRRNTNLDEAVNGFLVGASIPLFSNRHKTREAKAMHESRKYELEETKAQSKTAAHNLITELRHTQAAMKSYDISLMESTLTLLGKAAEAGQISIIDYYREADSVNESITKYLELQRKYYGLLAELSKNEI